MANRTGVDFHFSAEGWKFLPRSTPRRMNPAENNLEARPQCDISSSESAWQLLKVTQVIEDTGSDQKL
jgi:hypothetical protein